ncbi:malectin domain-containing carbohydrate-binding protein [Aquipuribacter hungaricus]|uniref:malectin domain-containing carbohydrate-binding protein n=1 Tax=Aquipuribacter hungaricus TaxID=545624 RepID=UPI003605E672
MPTSPSRRPGPAPLLGSAVVALGMLLGASVTAPAALATTPVTPPAVQPTVRINSGGVAGTFEGEFWQADRWFVGGRTSYSGDRVTGTTSSPLFQARRVAPAGYDIPVLPGTYDVTVLSAETYWTADGKRVFSATAEGRPLVSGLDLHAVAGHDVAHRVTGRVEVLDGTLDLDFTATADSAVVSGIVVAPVGVSGPTEPAEPGRVVKPVPTTPEPTWGAPALVDPLVWVPSPTSRVLKAPADRDVLVRWPAGELDGAGGYQINGGRNVVSIGGTINYSTRHVLGVGGEADRNRCLYIHGNTTAQAPRTVHVEGLRCAGPNIWEGINIDSKAERGTLTVQVRDIVMDEVQGLPGTDGSGHIGGDALQAWNGPHRLRIDGFDARNLHYQGLVLQPYSHGTGALGQWELRDVYLEGDFDGSAYLMWLSGARTGAGSVPITVHDVWVTPSPGKTATRTLWERATDWPDVTVLPPLA